VIWTCDLPTGLSATARRCCRARPPCLLAGSSSPTRAPHFCPA